MFTEGKTQCCGSFLESQLVRRLRQEEREFEASLGYVGMGGGGRGMRMERRGRRRRRNGKGREQMGKRETGKNEGREIK